MKILAGATTWLRRIVDIALVVLIIVVLVAIALGKLVPLTGRESIVIGGASMEPAIHLGSAVVVTPVAPADLAVGEVVSMKIDPARTTYTHRIVAVVDRPDGRWIRTKGDANADPDPTLVPASAVIGRVDLAIPLLGYLLALLSLPTGVMFTIGLAATLLAMAWLLESLELTPREPDAPAAAPATSPAAITPTRGIGERLAPRLAAPAFPAMAGQLVPSASDIGPVRSIGGLRAWAETSGRAEASAPVEAAAFDPRAAARPTVAEGIARSRKRRSQYASWLAGDRRRKTTAD